MASWPISAHLGGILEQLAGNMADKMATCRQLGRTWAELGRSWEVLGRSWEGLGGLGAVKLSVEVRWGRGLTDCASPVEDEVFEEEESAEVLGDLARPCHPVCDRGRRIQPAEREPRRGLTATYCTPNAKPCGYEVSAA